MCISNYRTTAIWNWRWRYFLCSQLEDFYCVSFHCSFLCRTACCCLLKQHFQSKLSNISALEDNHWTCHNCISWSYSSKLQIYILALVHPHLLLWFSAQMQRNRWFFQFDVVYLWILIKPDDSKWKTTHPIMQHVVTFLCLAAATSHSMTVSDTNTLTGLTFLNCTLHIASFSFFKKCFLHHHFLFVN